MTWGRRRGLIKELPVGLEIKKGYKATGENVPRSYVFGRWYRKRVHVLPADLPTVIKNSKVYDCAKGLYRCEYAGTIETYDPFILPEYVKVIDEHAMVVFMYDGTIQENRKIIGRWRPIKEDD